MGSKTTTTESSNEPWEGYQPYLTGTGPLPGWLTQQRPTGLSPAMSDYVQGLASGDFNAMMSTAPLQSDGWGPFSYGQPMPGGVTPGTGMPGGGMPGGGLGNLIPWQPSTPMESLWSYGIDVGRNMGAPAPGLIQDSSNNWWQVATGGE